MTARERSRVYGLEWADAIRDEDIFIFSIGLGNPAEPNPLMVPDMDYLEQIANEEGMVDSCQPNGRAYFAPSAAELEEVFQAVAKDIVVRLTK